MRVSRERETVRAELRIPNRGGEGPALPRIEHISQSERKSERETAASRYFSIPSLLMCECVMKNAAHSPVNPRISLTSSSWVRENGSGNCCTILCSPSSMRCAREKESQRTRSRVEFDTVFAERVCVCVRWGRVGEVVRGLMFVLMLLQGFMRSEYG